ncbi:MAG: hypothetical protein HYV90_03790 [Candidatus Woesebacteria bacterium]|nr:MAG: hypothetical protein HYV90_03790 [Candidatus Woesebacteria bacterium]
MKDVYESKDRKIVPFLLTQESVTFLGVRKSGSIMFFRFSPKRECDELVNQFSSRKAPLVQPKDLLDAVDTFKDRVFEMKDGGNNYGNNS